MEAVAYYGVVREGTLRYDGYSKQRIESLAKHKAAELGAVCLTVNYGNGWTEEYTRGEWDERWRTADRYRWMDRFGERLTEME